MFFSSTDMHQYSLSRWQSQNWMQGCHFVLSMAWISSWFEFDLHLKFHPKVPLLLCQVGPIAWQSFRGEHWCDHRLGFCLYFHPAGWLLMLGAVEPKLWAPTSKLQKDNHYQQISIKTNREEHSDALHWRPNSWCARARNLPIFSFFPSLLALHGGSCHHQSPIHGLPISSSTPLFPRAKSNPQGQDTHLPSICRSLTRSCCPSNSV